MDDKGKGRYFVASKLGLTSLIPYVFNVAILRAKACAVHETNTRDPQEII